MNLIDKELPLAAGPASMLLQNICFITLGGFCG
jgi:hypothetical protein